MSPNVYPALRPIPHRGLLLPLVGALVVLAWIALWVWDLDHAVSLTAAAPDDHVHHAAHPPPVEAGTHSHASAHHAPSDAAPRWRAVAATYVGGWLLMTIAMMLPTTLPLLEIFRRMIAARSDRGLLLALLIVGYLAIWLAFGLLAFAAIYGLQHALVATGWAEPMAWFFGSAPLLLAGAFQFTRLKYRCLEDCRAPLGFVVQHWRGGAPWRQALAIGVHHGAYCVGCCWALMLVMFAVGTAHLTWMLLLGGVMAIEKNVRWGRRISAPLGLTLIAWGAVLALMHWLHLPADGIRAGRIDELPALLLVAVAATVTLGWWLGGRLLRRRLQRR
ncbi:MAG TPA: DUF2182 domain-containing protein [Burkholderiaceae bacterium]|nr:DUF2182 domain-containing protein [Burkholderiaceae bacterium]